jgi:hypothetical protein
MTNRTSAGDFGRSPLACPAVGRQGLLSPDDNHPDKRARNRGTGLDAVTLQREAPSD